jgi:glutathione S-transferase
MVTVSGISFASRKASMSKAVLTINSRNYGAWSFRSWLLCRMAGLDFVEDVQLSDDPSSRAELLQISPSFLIPFLEHDGVKVWDTMAIAEHLHEALPQAKALLPTEPVARAHCRSISGELHSGFQSLRSALPMNIKRRHPGFKVWAGAQADIDRVLAIWQECLDRYGGPWLFGSAPTMADAMYAPECSRFVTYDVSCNDRCSAYIETVLGCPEVVEWVTAAQDETEDLDEFEAEF